MGLTLVALIVVLYAASQIIVLGSFSSQEEQETRQNVERVTSAIDDNLRSLLGTTRDWSNWDDTYNYIQGKNQAYFEDNLVDDSSMDGNQLNLMVFVNNDARIVLAKAYDYREHKIMPMPESLRNHIYVGSPLLDHSDISTGRSGIISLSEGPMLVDAEPILTSQGEGPAQGTLIFGRFLDGRAVAHLAKATLLNISLQALDDPSLDADFSAMRPNLSVDSRFGLKPLDANTMAGYSLRDDIYGKPAFMLKIEMPRDAYARGQQTIQYYVLTLIVSGIVFGLVLALVLRTLVLSRVAKLKSDVGRIEASTDMSGRVAIKGDDDELKQLAGSINSMLTALQRSREEQRAGEERYKALVEQITDAIFLVDAKTGHFLEANLAAQTLLGYEHPELMEMTLQDVAQPDPDKRTGTFTGMKTTGSLHLPSERHYLRKNGSVVTVEVSDSHISYEGRDALCVVARDITDRKKAETVLRDLAMRDGLTGLYNRREMQRILKEQIEKCKQYGETASLILFDIDHFKTVNDTYGHQVGDDVLRWMARLVQEMVRPEDKVARYGGEELAVILPGLDSEAAFQIADRLRITIAAHPFEGLQGRDDVMGGLLIPITISVGVASVPNDADTLTGVIDCADRALYEAKHKGRNRTFEYAALSDVPHLRLVR